MYAPDDPRSNAGGTIKIAVIGGGTGLSTLIRGLKKYSSHISAIVAVTDDGKSSGILRKDFDMLPPGDIRKCISALAYDEELISSLMEYRFSDKEKSFEGHTLGNIWIAALTKYFGSFELAVEATTEIFKTAGQVIPATLDKIQLGAIYSDSSKVLGESNIPNPGKKINKVFLNKEKICPNKKAVEAIISADLIIIGPGSLFTSVIPNILIRDIKNAVKKNSRAVRIFIANCSTERGETEGFAVADHIKMIETHAKGKIFDWCLVNNKVLKQSKKESELGEIHNITTEKEQILGYKICSDNVVRDSNPLYHDSDKLAKSIIELYNKVRS